MNRKEFLKTGMLAAATVGVAPALISWIPQHNWRNYDFGPGPEVKDRLYQGPFPMYKPENFFDANPFQYTTRGKQVINCFGMGLQTYISGDHDAPAVPAGKTLDQVIDELVSFSPGTKLYIRPCWKTLQKKRGRLDFDDYVKITLEKAAKYGKRIGFRVNWDVPQQYPRDANIKPDYTLFLPDYVLEKVPWTPMEGEYNGRTDWELLDCHNPYFLEYFEEFMGLLAEQWNGSNVIEWMDTAMFGWWGEGHAFRLRKGELKHNYPSYSVAEETWLKIWDIQEKTWTKVPLVTNVQPDCNHVGNSELVDRTIRTHNWIRNDSIMVHNERIEAMANRPPWIAAIQEEWISYKATGVDAEGLPPNCNLFDKARDLGVNYMNVAIHNSVDNSLENINNWYGRFPETLDHLNEVIGFRVRPSWIWRYRADTGRDGLIFGMVNDGVACVPGIIRLTLFNDRNPCLVTGCLDAGYPMTRGVCQAAMVLPEGVAWDSGVKVKAELECKGVRYPIPFACAQKLNPDGSLNIAAPLPRNRA